MISSSLIYLNSLKTSRRYVSTNTIIIFLKSTIFNYYSLLLAEYLKSIKSLINELLVLMRGETKSQLQYLQPIQPTIRSSKSSLSIKAPPTKEQKIANSSSRHEAYRVEYASRGDVRSDKVSYQPLQLTSSSTTRYIMAYLSSSDLKYLQRESQSVYTLFQKDIQYYFSIILLFITSSQLKEYVEREAQYQPSYYLTRQIST